MTVEYRTVEKFDNYEAGTNGIIRWKSTKKPVFIENSAINDWHPMVKLTNRWPWSPDKPKEQRMRIDWFITKTFPDLIPQSEAAKSGVMVDLIHIDGDKKNCSVSNLKWGDHDRHCFIAYYTDADSVHHIYDTRDNTYSTSTKKLPKDRTCYHVTKGYKASKKGLKKFADATAIEVREIEKCKGFGRFGDHRRTYNGVQHTFLRLCKGKYEHHERITYEEHTWMERCHNGGLTYCRPGTYKDCVGYDYKGFYPSIMASDDFKIPVKTGMAIHLDKLPKKRSKIEFGFYNVKITCKNEEFRKIFAFSKDNVYTHYSLKFAMKYKKRFDVKIKMNTDTENNAYVYASNTIVSGSEVFGEWYKVLLEMKSGNPKNKMIKMLMSTLWGNLTGIKTKIVEEDDLDDYDIGNDDSATWFIHDIMNHADGSESYMLIHRDAIYRADIRLKSFLTAFGRNLIAKVALEDLDNVVQIQTDGLCYNCDPQLDIENLIIDDKYAGHIKWSNVNKYERL